MSTIDPEMREYERLSNTTTLAREIAATTLEHLGPSATESDLEQYVDVLTDLWPADDEDEPVDNGVAADARDAAWSVWLNLPAQEEAPAKHGTLADYGTLTDYGTGESLRPATLAERARSLEAAQQDGGAGVIRVEGRSVYVAD